MVVLPVHLYSIIFWRNQKWHSTWVKVFSPPVTISSYASPIHSFSYRRLEYCTNGLPHYQLELPRHVAQEVLPAGSDTQF